jgi:hypothetical protein
MRPTLRVEGPTSCGDYSWREPRIGSKSDTTIYIRRCSPNPPTARAGCR